MMYMCVPLLSLALLALAPFSSNASSFTDTTLESCGAVCQNEQGQAGVAMFRFFDASDDTEENLQQCEQTCSAIPRIHLMRGFQCGHCPTSSSEHQQSLQNAIGTHLERQLALQGVPLSSDQKESLTRAALEMDAEQLVRAMLYLTEDDTTIRKLAEAGDEIVPDRFKLSARHYRKDRYAPEAAKQGQDYVTGAFTATSIIGRFRPEQGDIVPDHTGLKGKDTIREALETITFNADGTFEKGVFHIEDQAILQEIYEKTQALDWSQVQTVLYAVVPYSDGSVYSPAWNACYLVFANDDYTDEYEAVLWIMQAAYASGDFAALYASPNVGSGFAVSRAGVKYTPLTEIDNWYGYWTELNEYGALDFTVQMYHKEHEPTAEDVQFDIEDGEDASEFMYLQVTNTMEPATTSDLTSHEEHLGDTVLNKLQLAYSTIFKGALAYGLTEAYFQGTSPGFVMDKVNLDATENITVDDRIVGRLLAFVNRIRSAALWDIVPGPGESGRRSRKDRAALRTRLLQEARETMDAIRDVKMEASLNESKASKQSN